METEYLLIEIPLKPINETALTVIDRVTVNSIKLAESAFL
jgi:hypothetical protein